MPAEKDIRRNVRAHDAIAGDYDRIHADLLCSDEQRRLGDALRRAVAEIRVESQQNGRKLRALDFGCGSGNVTRHLAEMGLRITAADVSTKFLRRIGAFDAPRGAIETMRLNGRDLDGVANGTFDISACYSVLHHVPDYPAIVGELARVTRVGGVVFIDHEATGVQWRNDPDWLALQEIADANRQHAPWWRKVFQPARYLRRLRRLIRPRYQPEGDIHVWPDDHVEWDKVEGALIEAGCEIVLREDYLFPSPYWPDGIYERYKGRVHDIRLLVARKKPPIGGGEK